MRIKFKIYTIFESSMEIFEIKYLDINAVIINVWYFS